MKNDLQVPSRRLVKRARAPFEFASARRGRGDSFTPSLADVRTATRQAAAAGVPRQGYGVVGWCVCAHAVALH